MERRFGQTTVSLHQGDITRLAVDAIVNAANTHLWMGGGVAGAIKRVGGAAIEQEAVARRPIAVGALSCRHVIHAATMAQDLSTSGPAIRAATRASLRVADELGLGSIALPALGTGVGGFPLDEAAALMLEEITGYVRGPTGLVRIVLVAFNAEAAEAFSRVLEEA